MHVYGPLRSRICVLPGRVKMISLPDNNWSPFFSVFVRFIDVGKEVSVKSYQILQLPDQFQSLSGQATEIIVCRVKPADAETDWHPKVGSPVPTTLPRLPSPGLNLLTTGPNDIEPFLITRSMT